MGARLGDAAIFDHEDRIYAPDQPELVGDDEGGASFGQGPPALLHGGRGLGVEAGLGLVQDQYGGVPEHGPRDGDALPLPPAQALATLGEYGVVALRKLPDKPVGPGELGDGFDLLPARHGPPVGYVLGDTGPEQQGVLGHEGYGVAQRLEGKVLDVFPVDEHPPLLRVVQARDEAGDGGLARAADPHERDPAARLDVEIHATQGFARFLVVGEAHVIEADPAIELGRGTGAGKILYRGFRVQEVYDALARHQGGADLVYLPTQSPQGREEQREVGHEDGEVAQREGAGEDLPRPEVHDERRAEAADDAEHRAELGLYLRAVDAGLQGLPALRPETLHLVVLAGEKLDGPYADYGLLHDAGDGTLPRPDDAHPLHERLPVALDGEKEEGHGDEGQEGQLPVQPEHHDHHAYEDGNRGEHLDHRVDEHGAYLFYVAGDAGYGVTGALAAVVVETEGMNLGVQGLAHVEDGLLPELLQQVAPERRHAPGHREDQDYKKCYPGQKQGLVGQQVGYHFGQLFVVGQHVVDGERERPRLRQAHYRLEQQYNERDREPGAAGLQERRKVG